MSIEGLKDKSNGYKEGEITLQNILVELDYLTVI